MNKIEPKNAEFGYGKSSLIYKTLADKRILDRDINIMRVLIRDMMSTLEYCKCATGISAFTKEEIEQTLERVRIRMRIVNTPPTHVTKK